MPAPPLPPAKSSASRNRRGGGGRSRPSTQAQDAVSVDGEEGELACLICLISDLLTHYGNRHRCRSRAEQPALWGRTLTGQWLSAQPKHGGSRTASERVRRICLSPTGFLLPDVFVITATATATADIVGAARLPCAFGVHSAEQDATAIAVTRLLRRAWCTSSLAWEAHERQRHEQASPCARRVGWTRAGECLGAVSPARGIAGCSGRRHFSWGSVHWRCWGDDSGWRTIVAAPAASAIDGRGESDWRRRRCACGEVDHENDGRAYGRTHWVSRAIWARCEEQRATDCGVIVICGLLGGLTTVLLFLGYIYCFFIN